MARHAGRGRLRRCETPLERGEFRLRPAIRPGRLERRDQIRRRHPACLQSLGEAEADPLAERLGMRERGVDRLHDRDRAPDLRAFRAAARGEERVDRRLDALISDRDRTAAKLDIESALIAPRALLETIAANEADPAELLLNWQRQVLGLSE